MRITPLILLSVGLVAIGCGSDDARRSNVLEPVDGGGSDAGPNGSSSDSGDDDSDSGTPITSMKWKAVSVGGMHACALTVDGKAYCWGARFDGACGDGQSDNQQFDWDEPHPVTGGHAFTKIAAGQVHTCAIDTRGKLYCWGSNRFGAVGDGGSTHAADGRLSPVAIRSDLSFQDLAADDHTCAVDTAGKVYCWGSNGSQRAGGPSLTEPVLTPTQVPGTDSLVFESVTVGARHSCAVTTDGAAYCWGDRDDGKLGEGAIVFGSTATPVAVVGGIEWAQIAASIMHTCGIEKDTGHVNCWGSNVRGEHGIEPEDTVEYIPSPRKMTGDFKASAIIVVDANTCALDANGAAFCWGREDDDGVIANGKSTKSGVHYFSTPQPVTGGHTFANISGRLSMVCGTTTDGAIYCWGSASSSRFLNAEDWERNATPRKLPDPE